jgi:hypothetical protein
MDSTDRRLHATRTSYLALAFILLSIILNLLYPGEVFPQSRFLLLAFSILSSLIVLANGTYQRLGNLPDGILDAFLPLLIIVPSVFLSVSLFRSREVALLFFSYSCLYFTLRSIRMNETVPLISILAITLVTFVIDLHALQQWLIGLSHMKNEVSRTTDIEPNLKSAIINRISSGRVFAHFPLPNTLAGFLAMSLPLNLFLISLNLRPRALHANEDYLRRIVHSPWISASLILELLLSLAVLLLTQSFGGWVCCFGSLSVAAVIWLRGTKVKIRFLALGALLSMLAAASWIGWLNYRRGFHLWELSASENPISLRWIAFKTAWRIFEDSPLTGVGLGNYGTLNPRYQQSLAHVTQYAHNTPLQLLAECGFLLIPLGLLLLKRLRKIYLVQRHDGSLGQSAIGTLRRYLLVGLSAWAIHNCLDIDLYFPSLGAFGVLMLALFTGLHPAKDNSLQGLASSRKRSKTPALLFAVVLLVVLGIGTRFYASQALAGMATGYARVNEFGTANKLANWAVQLDPNNPQVIILRSKIIIQSLNQGIATRQNSLQLLQEAFERASQLDPFNAHLYYELSRIYSGIGNEQAAQQALERARVNFPSEPRFHPNRKSTK